MHSYKRDELVYYMILPSSLGKKFGDVAYRPFLISFGSSFGVNALVFF